jgi:hypothetical protein
MKTLNLFFLIAFGAVFLSSPATAVPDKTSERLKACAEIAEQVVRIACYEALGKETLAEDGDAADVASSDKTESTAVVAAPSAGATATSATSAPTNVPIKGVQPPEEFRVAVNSCRINNVGDIYLTLDNGEVWKRTGGDHLRESECSFTTTLRKDFFGYKMEIDGDERTVRVKRVK